MKKTYVRPCVSFESFDLNASIAQTCVIPMITHSVGCDNTGTQSDPTTGCKFYTNGYEVFVLGTCLESPVNAGTGSLCYHVPSDTNRIFIS